jgi:hypothetical protein
LPDPRRTLVDLAGLLKNDGVMIVEVPNSEDALLTLYDSESFQNFTYWSQHLYLFNAENLKTLANQAGLQVVAIQQYQRYPLSNHLYWLSQGKPAGHQKWMFMDDDVLYQAYSKTLAKIGRCDTLVAFLEKKNA